MFSSLPLAFANPALLTAFLALPVLWWLIRALPPKPKRLAFPPVRLLADLDLGDPPPEKTPLWVILLRLLIAGLVILALAGPLINPREEFAGDGPVLIVVDDGWQAASRWADRRASLDALLLKADREGRPAILLTTTPPPGGFGEQVLAALPGAEQPGAIRSRLAGFVPQPWAPDHAAAARRLAAASGEVPTHVVWLSDGLVHPGTGALAEALSRLGPLDIVTDEAARGPLALLPPDLAGRDLTATLARAATPQPRLATVEAVGSAGRLLAHAEAEFGADEDWATATLKLPANLRNQVRRLRIRGEASAGAIYLLDGRASRPSVGLIARSGFTARQPLQSAWFYLKRALEPYAEVSEGQAIELMDSGVSVLLAADVGRFAAQEAGRLTTWLGEGGVLIRFAGPRMAEGADDFVPVALRQGGRSFGGAMSWDEPHQLMPFDEVSPFFGLEIAEDVTVKQQLLAAPSIDLAEKTWARLDDGTPLVTAERRGRGWVVLVHTTADAEWSSLALSGLFVEMLQRVLILASPRGDLDALRGNMLLRPNLLMDGFGNLGAPALDFQSIRSSELAELAASAGHPPGFYGPDTGALALNLASANGPVTPTYRFRAIEEAVSAPVTRGFLATREIDLGPNLLIAAILLFLVDGLAALYLRGMLIRPHWRPGAALVPLLVAVAWPAPGEAQELDPDFVLNATRETRIAYVETGNARIDELSRAGLTTLGNVLQVRTAVRLAAPVAVNPSRDPLELFPLIYWPVPAEAGALDEDAVARLRRYLRFGGIVLFDSGVGETATRTGGMENPLARAALQRLFEDIDPPPLVPLASGHVLTNSFYLLDRFPGRLSGRPVWVEQDTEGEEGRVSPLIIGSHDWAAAWAIDAAGQPVVRSFAGGERQREFAFRFGVNLVMYALTGTYKADQLHVPALLQRLGQ